MADNVRKPRHLEIDADDLSELAGPESIRDFYMSIHDSLHDFYASEMSFIFDGFALELCCGGCRDVTINGRRHEMVPGSILLLPPNQLMEIGHTSEDFSRKSIMVSLDMILEFPSPVDIDIINAARRSPVIRVPESKMKLLLEYYRFIEERYEDVGNVYREEISKSLFYAMMLEISGIYRAVSGEASGAPKLKQERLCDEFFLLLSANYKRHRTVTFYAGCMNLTPKYLSSAVKRISGRSVPEWINEAVIIEIKRLLKTTDMTVLQISEYLNFSSPSAFVQFFRANVGVTPRSYRVGSADAAPSRPLRV